MGYDAQVAAICAASLETKTLLGCELYEGLQGRSLTDCHVMPGHMHET